MFTQKVAVTMHRRLLMGTSSLSLRCNVINRCIGSSSSKDDSAVVDTYYDSQSGQHVTIHDENKVSVYLRGNTFDAIYKERAGLISEAQSAIMQTAKDMGMAGSILSLPPEQIQQLEDRAKPPTIEWKQMQQKRWLVVMRV